MSVIYILIPIAVLLTSIGIYLFFWAVKTEQFDDLEKQGMSILFDDEAGDEDDEADDEDDKDDKDDKHNKLTINRDDSKSENK